MNKNSRLFTSIFKRPAFALVFFAIFLLAIILRFYQLGAVPVSLYWDEAAMLVDAKSIAQTGKDMHGSSWLQAMFPSYGDYKLPIYIWLASISVKLFGVSAWALRLPSAIIGVIYVLVIGLLAVRALASDKKASTSSLIMLITMAITAVTPWAVLFSRTGFEGHIGQFFLTISILFLYLYDRGSSRTKVIFFGLSIIAGVTAVYAYYSVRFVWPVVFVSFFLLQAKSVLIQFTPSQYMIKFSARSFIPIIVGLVCWLILLLPLQYSPHYQASQTFRLSTDSILKNEQEIIQSNVYREIAGNGPVSRILYHRYVLTGRELIKNYSAHLDPNYLFVTGDDNLRHGTGRSGLFQIWMLPLMIIGVLLLLKRKPTTILFLAIWWLVALLPASVPTAVPHALRSLNALTPTILIISFGMWYLIALYQEHASQRFAQLIAFFVCVLMIGSTTLFTHDYFGHYPTRSAYDWQDGYRQLSVLLEAEKSPVRTVWVNPDDERLYLWLMIYGPYTAQDFQSWQSQDYKFSEISTIVFEPFDWGKLETLDHKIIIVEKSGQLQGQPYRVQQVKDASGTPRFDVGWYGR